MPTTAVEVHSPNPASSKIHVGMNGWWGQGAYLIHTHGCCSEQACSDASVEQFHAV
jgi:hypothetical protein